MANIMSRTATLCPAERLAMFGGLVRFAMEMLQQVSEAMITDRNPHTLFVAEDEGNLMMMQTHLQVGKARSLLTGLQSVLEKQTHRAQKAGLLLRNIKGQVEQWDHLGGLAQDLVAMLLVYQEDLSEDLLEDYTVDDTAWASEWWTSLQEAQFIAPTSGSATSTSVIDTCFSIVALTMAWKPSPPSRTCATTRTQGISVMPCGLSNVCVPDYKWMRFWNILMEEPRLHAFMHRCLQPRRPLPCDCDSRLWSMKSDARQQQRRQKGQAMKWI